MHLGRRLVALGLSACLALSTSVTAFAENVQVFLKDDRPIDIILAAGDTDYDLSQFESNLRTALDKAKVDLNRVKIQAVQATNSDTDDNFDWKEWSTSSNAYTHKVGVGPKKFNWGTSFKEQETWTLKKNEIIVDGDYSDPYTAGVRYTVPADEADRVTKFALEFTLDPSEMLSHPKCSAYFLVCGFRFSITGSENNWKTTISDPSGKQPHNFGALNSPTHFRLEVTKKDAKIYKGNVLEKTWDLKDVKLTGMELGVSYGDHNCSAHAYFKMSDVIMETQVAKDLVDVIRAPDWRPDSHRFVFDVNDKARDDFKTGNSLGECIQRMVADGGYYIGFGRTGTAGSQTQANEFIAKLGSSSESKDGRYGMFWDNTKGMDEPAKFIEYIVNKQNSGTGDLTVLQNRAFQYSISPASLASNTASGAFANGRWRINYDKTYTAVGGSKFTFEGDLEPPYWTGKERSDFTFNTGQVGVYNLLFENNPVKPKRIIVHQLPVAQFSTFSVKYQAGTGRYLVSFVTNSYDPDAPKHRDPKTNALDMGIAKHEFKYRAAGLSSNATWLTMPSRTELLSNGQLRVSVDLPKIAGTEYELMYVVTDYQGAKSAPIIKYVNGNSQRLDIKPIASFDFPTSKISTYEWGLMASKVKNGEIPPYNAIQDSSYDPMGYTLSKYKWQWLNTEGKPLGAEFPASPNTGAGVETIMSRAPSTPGMYYLQLIVERTSGGSAEYKVSEPYKRVIEFTREAYSMWFTELANWSVITKENGTSLTVPKEQMKGPSYNNGKPYNRSLGFAAATIPSDAKDSDKPLYPRRVTFNALHGGVGRKNTRTVYIEDANGGRKTLTLTEYDVELTDEFLWPVTSQQIAKGDVMLALWGTPVKDWALVPDQSTGGVPRYINNTTRSLSGRTDNHWFIRDVIPWNGRLDDYKLISVTREQAYNFTAKVPGRAAAPLFIYSPTLNRKVFDWETGTYRQETGKYSFGKNYGSGLTIKVPSRMTSVVLQGEGGYSWETGSARREDVSAVYFRETDTTNASAPGKLGYKERKNTTDNITVTTPAKGQTRTLYFYVAPETSLIHGEVYKDVGTTTSETYADDKYATSRTPVRIYRMKDNADLRLNGTPMKSSQETITLTDNFYSNGSQKPVVLNLQMVDPDAIIRGIRLNGASSYTKVNNKATNFTFTPTQSINTIDILVSPEDREVQKLYTVKVIVPDTFQGTSAIVTYKTTDKGNFSGVLSGNTFTVTVPENVRNGKLSVQAVNEHSIVSKIAKETYSTNAVEIDWELPLHNNPNTTFTIQPVQGGSKTYSIKFVKQSTPPTVTLTNSSKLEGVFSPQGKWYNNTYTAYEHISDAGVAFNGNGIPVEVEIRNKETVQGVTAEVIFNKETFPIHWDTYDGPVYRDGASVMKGYAVISKSALSGLNGNQAITCNVYTYDYEGSDPVDKSTGISLRTIKVDSTGPNFGVSATINPSMIRFTGITDNMVPAGNLDIKWGSEFGSGYNNSYSLDTENQPNIQVRVDGVTGEIKCLFRMSDVLGNVTELERKLDFSDVAGIDVHMEFGRNADGYYVNVRKDENESVGHDRFDFIQEP